MRNGQEPIYNNSIMKTLLRTLLGAVCCMVTNMIFAYDVEIDGIYYNCSHSIYPEVTYKDIYKGTPEYFGNIVIPETIIYEGESYTVKHIGYDAFAGCTNLKSVILPNSISLINNRAFKGCTGLTYVYIPQNANICEDAFKDCPNLHLYQHPNDAKVNVSMTVIDTLKAESIFQEMKPALMKAYQKRVDKKERCNELCGMLGKKVKEENDLTLIRQAYNCYLSSFPYKREYQKKVKFVGFGNGGIYGLGSETVEKVDKNVEKGKITEQVQQYLSYYHKYLTDRLKNEHDKIERGWSEWLSQSELPYKQITIPMPNSFYRGYRYFRNDDLDSLDKYQQQKGWEFLDTENRKFRSESYPEEVEYLVYDAAPEYRVTYSRYNIKEVYDKDGKLVYVPSLLRKKNEAELKDVRRLVYFKDYINNKYDIQSQPKQTQEYLKLVLCRDNGFEETASDALGSLFTSALVGYVAQSTLSPVDAYKVQNQAKGYAANQALRYSDSVGKKYIEQLEKDHAEECGYVYMIVRLSNVSFQVVYINKETLEPSYCAVITYKTGEKPYTSTFSTKLINIPESIPPIIRD